ncbi:hydroxysqualene dehydroxylase HpnE [Thalassobaculum salexigens]|uniref:hydroxysqualene dehydroxylase HpnE n=1 Tax=Thalassobaculum salexigens TaxID=455360 RepID=UPI00248EABE6|nr:hydroxysqualene dehydroxylase HpnE [Thalassobaculum salexigens]
MSGGTVHVIGAGLAGLAAALSLSAAGRTVALHEAAGHAGGRCRSYIDPRLGCRIDNGNHLLLSANRSALAYLAEIGASGSLRAGDAAFAFHDIADGRQWTVRPGEGGVWRRLTAPLRQVPGAGAADALGLLRLAVAGRRSTVMQALGPGALMERFWRPLTVAVLNAEPEVASARLLRGVIREVLRTGEAVPLTAREGLSESFVDPALAVLAERGVGIGFGRRLRGVDTANDRATALRFAEETVALAPGDALVLAVPAPIAAGLLPGLAVPDGSSAIVNAHFRLDAPAHLPGRADLIGLTGGTAQWLFRRGEIASVTVSAADALLDRPSEDLAAILWRDIAPVLGLAGQAQPPARIVKERRATFRQDPASLARRPPARTAWRNLALAGDWTDTGLPATIEGAIRSGRDAASLLISGTGR